MPRMIPSELCRFALSEDERNFLKYLFAIATGRVNFDMNLLAVNVSYEAQLLAAFVATEMLLRINSQKVQWMQMTLTDQMTLYNIARKERHILAQMRLLADDKTVYGFATDQICKSTLAMFKPVAGISLSGSLTTLDSG
jgi:hypothetical protein